MDEETNIMSRIRRIAGLQTKEDVDEAFGIVINPDKEFGLAEPEPDPINLDDIFDAALDQNDIPDHAVAANPFQGHDIARQRDDFDAMTAQTVTYALGGSFKIPDPPPILYTGEDIDKLIKMLTLWIDDRTVIVKMEEMYKQWKDLQKKK
jgi:hypothetical protein